MCRKKYLICRSRALLVITICIGIIPTALGQTFTVIHGFTCGNGGSRSTAGVTINRSGNLYGTTIYGGSENLGMVFELVRKANGWIFTPLYSFQGGSDGANPNARVVFGPDGSLYGTTPYGGGGDCSGGCGTVFKLRPPLTVCKTSLCPWTETVLYRFSGIADGFTPIFGDLIFDDAGNIYGTTTNGGNPSSLGTVWELTHSNNGWTKTILYSFRGGNEGQRPFAGVIFDDAGNLYGTTAYGGPGVYGTVYELTPSGSGWTENILHWFDEGSDGGEPMGGLIFDPPGNLYGPTSFGGSGGAGTVFELSPSGNSWFLTTIANFTGNAGPHSSLTIDAVGHLYGTTLGAGRFGLGSVFNLTYSDGWSQTVLHNFTGSVDGAEAWGGPTLDPDGNLYGTTSEGGIYGCGTVWELTQ